MLSCGYYLNEIYFTDFNKPSKLINSQHTTFNPIKFLAKTSLVSYDRDWRVVLLDNLSFSEHIHKNLIYNKAIQNLGFLKRYYIEFNDSKYLIVLY